MEQLQQLRADVMNWYATDESKEYVFYAALISWISMMTLNMPLTAFIATRPDNTVIFLAFVLFWLFPTLSATTYWLASSLRQYTLAQYRRMQQLQGSQLEVNVSPI